MKKPLKNKLLLVSILGIIIVLVLITLYSTKETICSKKSDQSKNGYIYETKYVIKSRRGIVKKVEINEIITSKDNDLLKKYEKSFKEQYSHNKKTYGGYKYKVTNKNGKVTTRVIINYNTFNMKKFISSNPSMKRYIENDKYTLNKAIKLYKSTGATCK